MHDKQIFIVYERYWATGLTAPDAAAKHANPTLAFARSGEVFPLHGGSTPCLAFDLFEPVANGKDIYAACKARFRACALSRSAPDGLFVAQWANTPLKLLDSYPRRFTAIDTSNLVDALGLMNVLLCAKPLLADNPRAVLYTESPAGTAGRGAVKTFRDALCGELPAVALVLGLAPAAYVDGLASHSRGAALPCSAITRE